MTNRELGRPVMGAQPPGRRQPRRREKRREGSGAARRRRQEKEKPEPRDPALIRFKRDQATSQDSDRVKQLYQQLADAKKQAGEAPVPLDRVAALVKAQVDKFKSEGQDVTFKVALKDGKVSLTVKPVKDE